MAIRTSKYNHLFIIRIREKGFKGSFLVDYLQDAGFDNRGEYFAKFRVPHDVTDDSLFQSAILELKTKGIATVEIEQPYDGGSAMYNIPEIVPPYFYLTLRTE